ncbi:NAD(P)H-flavin reductase [Candidatus Enterovibrio altilux]|uniref:NAD(P)H-flavin reductase n=1 Tax=Candidatus Enterovibrio altilux TaxID=1927128 RepID=A0A291B9H0_9GAMM|nr:NAD(P)H-flavin reductase [Candidatus Enterovibrio luxaltus]ATF09623.1 NAD(P)H-flavin reductase [Candidatus Enterovibrio luxaltus]
MTIKCAVKSVSLLTDSIYRILLQPAAPVSYKAGQYLLVVLGTKNKHPFSIVSSPCRQNGHELELHICVAKKNACALDVVNASKATLEKGDDSFLIEAPHGDAWLREERQRPLILVAGGTGFSYVRSMIDYCLSQNFTQLIFLYWGGRDINHLYSNNEMKMLALKHSQLNYIPVLENAPKNWSSKIGNVLEAVMEDFVSLSKYDVYIAGRLEMVIMAREKFCNERGVRCEHLFADAFAYL